MLRDILYLLIGLIAGGIIGFLVARKYMKNGWNYITNEVVYAWAIMYFSLPNSFLKIEKKDADKSKNKTKTSSKKASSKNNVVSLEKAKENMEKKKETAQISLFGGVA